MKKKQKKKQTNSHQLLANKIRNLPPSGLITAINERVHSYKRKWIDHWKKICSPYNSSAAANEKKEHPPL